MNITIAQLISSLHNAQNANLDKFTLVSSSLLTSILDLLTINGYITGYTHKNDTTDIYLKYPLKNKLKIELVSKPSKKQYITKNGLRRKFFENDFLILSSSYGLVTNKEAEILNVGGEVLLKIK